MCIRFHIDVEILPYSNFDMKKIQSQGSNTEKIELPNKLVIRETTHRI